MKVLSYTALKNKSGCLSTLVTVSVLAVFLILSLNAAELSQSPLAKSAALNERIAKWPPLTTLGEEKQREEKPPSKWFGEQPVRVLATLKGNVVERLDVLFLDISLPNLTTEYPRLRQDLPERITQKAQVKPVTGNGAGGTETLTWTRKRGQGNGVRVQLLDKCVPLAENGGWHAAFAFNPPGRIITSWPVATVARTFFMMMTTGGSSCTR